MSERRTLQMELLTRWQDHARRALAAVARGVAVSVFLGPCSASSSLADQLAPPLRRGVGLHGPLTWGETNPERTAYVWPVYPSPKYDVPVALLREAKRAGLDFVRLSVDPGPLIAFGGDEARELDRRLSAAAGQIRALGFDVLVDLHPISEVKGYTAKEYEGEGESGLFPKYLEAVARVAHLLSADPAHLAIEPMNEPQLGYDASSRARWASMQRRLYDAVRAAAPDLTVVATGGRGGGLEGLLDLDPSLYRDSGVRFSFHYYLPYEFTHQGVTFSSKSSRLWPFVSGLPYPADPTQRDQIWGLVAKRIADSTKLTGAEKDALLRDGRRQIEAYFAGGGSRASISRNFDLVSGWAQRHRIARNRIFLGEFGATQENPHLHGARPEDRIRWLSDVREEAESRGFGWSVWALSGTWGMNLASVANPQEIDLPTAGALGLSVE